MSGAARDARRVAVTGIGVVSPIGVGRDAFWRALCAGRSGVAPLTEDARASDFPTCAAQVHDFSPRDFIHSPHFRRMDDLSRMIVAASRMAVDDAGVKCEAQPPESIGIVVGSALGDTRGTVAYLEKLFGRGPSAASPMIFPNLVLNAPASYVAMELGATGSNLTVSQAEISGEQAIQTACDVLREARAGIVIAGGGDEICATVTAVYRRAGVLAGQRGGPEVALPYGAGRDGIVLGEGAAMLVIERWDDARARGAQIYAEIDADCAFAVPAPLYDWPSDARRALPALERLDLRDVDLVLGSANGSPRLDACEIDLLGRLLGERAANVSVTSIKGAVGEIGATGALTAAAACLALREQVVPPLHARDEIDLRCGLRLAPRQSFEREIRAALLLGIARGGAGAALLLRRAE